MAVASWFVASRQRVPGSCHRRLGRKVVDFLYKPSFAISHHLGNYLSERLTFTPVLPVRFWQPASGVPVQFVCMNVPLSMTYLWT